jgi:transcriptional regulator CtsR
MLVVSIGNVIPQQFRRTTIERLLDNNLLSAFACSVIKNVARFRARFLHFGNAIEIFHSEFCNWIIAFDFFVGTLKSIFTLDVGTSRD